MSRLSDRIKSERVDGVSLPDPPAEPGSDALLLRGLLTFLRGRLADR